MTGDSLYGQHNHKEAFLNFYLKAKTLGNSDAEKRIDSLIFSQTVWGIDESLQNQSYAPGNITYSRDKAICIVTDKNKTGIIWNISGENPRELFSTADINKPQFSPDNKFLQFFDSDSSLHIWDMASKKEILIRLQNNDNTFPSRAYIAQFLTANYLVIYEKDSSPGIISLNDKTQSATYSKAADFIGGRPPDFLLPFDSDDIPEYVNGEIIYTFEGPLQISHDEKILSSLNRETGKLLLHDIEKKSQILSFRNIRKLKFHPSQPLFFLLDTNGNLIIGNYISKKYKIISYLKGQKKYFTDFVYSAERNKLYINSLERAGYNYSLSITGDPIAPAGPTISYDNIHDRLIFEEGVILTLNNFTDSSIIISNANKDSAKIPRIISLEQLRFDAKSKTLVVTDEKNILHVINYRNMKEVVTIDSVNTERIFFDGISEKIYYNDSLTNNIYELNIPTKERKNLGNASATIVRIANGLLELAFTKTGSSIRSKCLINPKILPFKGSEKIEYLQKLFTRK
jgi:WD40 repeat protein